MIVTFAGVADFRKEKKDVKSHQLANTLKIFLIILLLLNLNIFSKKKPIQKIKISKISLFTESKRADLL